MRFTISHLQRPGANQVTARLCQLLVAISMTAATVASAQSPAATTRPVASPQPSAWRFEREVTALERAIHDVPSEPGTILFYGSSSVRLWASLKEDFPGRHVANAGFGGSTASDALHYMDRLVIPMRPSTIVFYEGDNDLAMGRTPDALLADYQSFARRVQEKLPSTRIIYLSVKPSPERTDLMPLQRRTNALLQDWIQTTKSPRLAFVDVFRSMLDAQGKPRECLFGEDRLHMNHDGYQLWAQALGNVLGQEKHATARPTVSLGLTRAE